MVLVARFTQVPALPPVDVPFNVVELPVQIAISDPAFAVRFPVVIRTVSVDEQVPFETVTV